MTNVYNHNLVKPMLTVCQGSREPGTDKTQEESNG
jgi:hypothetical protein